MEIFICSPDGQCRIFSGRRLPGCILQMIAFFDEKSAEL